MAGTVAPECEEVVVRFDGTRIGTAPTDQAGGFSARRLTVPGDAAPGPHQVSISCDLPAREVRASSPFVVSGAALHRSAFVTSLARPDQVPAGLAAIIGSALLALLLVLLLAFPSQLFNSTYEEHHDEIRGWFDRARRARDAIATVPQVPAIAAFTAAGALLYGFLDPQFGLNASSLALFTGLLAGVAVLSFGSRLPGSLYVHRRHGEWGRLVLVAGSVLIAALCVAVSRLVHFQPGYLYGLLATLAFRRALDLGERGRLAAMTSVSLLGAGVASWLLVGPVSALAAEPGAGFWVIALEAALVMLFLQGAEGVAMGMVPLSFLDGSKVYAWSKGAWLALSTASAFLVVHVLLRPGSGYVGHTARPVALTVLVLCCLFAAASVGFWSYFRFRRPRPAG